MSAATARQLIPTLHVDCTCRECTPSPHPLTRIDAIAEALQPTPVTVTLDAADAFIGCKQLRSIVAAFRMPAESRELLLRLAAAMEVAK